MIVLEIIINLNPVLHLKVFLVFSEESSMPKRLLLLMLLYIWNNLVDLGLLLHSDSPFCTHTDAHISLHCFNQSWCYQWTSVPPKLIFSYIAFLSNHIVFYEYFYAVPNFGIGVRISHEILFSWKTVAWINALKYGNWHKEDNALSRLKKFEKLCFWFYQGYRKILRDVAALLCFWIF